MSQGSEALPSSSIENASRASLTRRRMLPGPARRAVGLCHTETATEGASMPARVFRMIRHPNALIALGVIAMSLSACAATNRNAFLGPAYDGPTAAYGYNMP